MKQNEHRRQILLYVAGLGFLWLAQSTHAQVTTATILGVVRDESGAVLPGATVTARNVETRITRTVTSGSDGQYRVPQLALGSYEVEAQQKGFQTEMRKGIVLTIGREAVVDFWLKAGAVVETVSVTAEAPLVETTNSSVANLEHFSDRCRSPDTT